jgi:hypothetical protein
MATRIVIGRRQAATISHMDLLRSTLLLIRDPHELQERSEIALRPAQPEEGPPHSQTGKCIIHCCLANIQSMKYWTVDWRW